MPMRLQYSGAHRVRAALACIESVPRVCHIIGGGWQQELQLTEGADGADGSEGYTHSRNAP